MSASERDGERWAEAEADARAEGELLYLPWSGLAWLNRATHIAAARATLDHFGLTLPPEPSPAEMIAIAYCEARGWGDHPDDRARRTDAFAALLEDGTLKAAVDAYEAGDES